jgi:IS30 family transposase
MIYSHLTVEQRYVIERLLPQGHTYDEIAAIVECDPTTVGREVRRNSVGGVYRAHAAQNRADRRRGDASHAPRAFTSSVCSSVEAQLREGWSPEQISNRMRDEGKPTVSHERIYQHVWQDRCDGGDLHHFLRQASRLRRKRYGTHSRKGALPNRTMIDARPAVVDERSRIGDWEVDTVVGARHLGAIVTLVERRSGYLLTELLRSPNADAMRTALLKVLEPHRDRVLTITADNDRAFAHHAIIGRKLAAAMYFAHPYHAWERGTNENTNGLLRQYFPKGTDFQRLTQRDVLQAQEKLNHRPRKRLGWKTPHEVYFDTRTPFFQ